MRSLIVNQSDSGGGAAIAAMTLHQALQRSGVQSHVAVARRTNFEDPNVHQLPSGNRFAGRVLSKASFHLGLSGASGLGAFSLAKEDYFRAADVVNLHLLHGGYFSYFAIPRLGRNKPLVMTLHDMWHFTGHCVYSFDCDRWINGCGSCKYPDIYAGVQRDATAWNVRQKSIAFHRGNVHLVAISHWIKSLLAQSVLNDLPVHYIPNGIDTDVYRPSNQQQSRDTLGINSERPVVLCCAANFADSRKGMDLLCDAILRLSEEIRNSMLLLVMGNMPDLDRGRFSCEVRSLGYVADVATKRDAYNAADVFALPTRADNLPVVLQESLSCGTPMVSFNVGGVPDLVRDGQTGLLAKPESADDFAHCLQTLLVDAALRQSLAGMCRNIAVGEYTLDRQGAAYRSLFESLIE